MQGMCFWGEHFTFTELPKKVEKISLLIYKDRGIRRRRNPVGRVKICVSSIQSRREVEKWYPLEKSSRRETPSIRLKCQFQSIDILPLRDYEELRKWLRDDYKSLCKMLEPNINVKVKDELSSSLMAVFHIQDVAEDILADIVVQVIFTSHWSILIILSSHWLRRSRATKTRVLLSEPTPSPPRPWRPTSGWWGRSILRTLSAPHSRSEERAMTDNVVFVDLDR